MKWQETDHLQGNDITNMRHLKQQMAPEDSGIIPVTLKFWMQKIYLLRMGYNKYIFRLNKNWANLPALGIQ